MRNGNTNALCFLRRVLNNVADDEGQMTECACGCGKSVKIVKGKYYQCKFIKGHRPFDVGNQWIRRNEKDLTEDDRRKLRI